jgi:hypothetical protein
VGPPAPVEPEPEPAGVRVSPPVVFAIALSVLVHVLILLFLTQRFIFPSDAGAASDGDEGTHLAIVTDSQLTELVEASLTMRSPEAPALADPMSPEIDFDSPISAEAIANLDPGDSAALLRTGDPDDLEQIDASSVTAAASSFFGLEARGMRFAYVVDVSSSMSRDDRLETLQRELVRSIEALEARSEFVVVIYASDARVVGPRRWQPATEQARSEVAREISAFRAAGLTEPVPAFEIVLSLRPKPDAVFFMTDGDFDSSDAGVIARLNDAGSRRTPINTITFVDREGELVMRRIARESGGRYRHVAGPGS